MVNRRAVASVALSFLLLLALGEVAPAFAQFVPAREYSYLRGRAHVREADVMGGERNGWGASPGVSRELSERVHVPGSVEYSRGHQPTSTDDVVMWRVRSGVGLDLDLGRRGSMYLRTQALWLELESEGEQWNEVVGHYSTGLRYQVLEPLEARFDVSYVDHDEEITDDASTNYRYSLIYYANPDARDLVAGVGPFYRYRELDDVDMYGLEVFWYFR